MMNDDEAQQHKPPGGITRKGFVKGDPRCYRLGRPKHFDEFRKLAQKISHEKVPGPDGNTLSRVEAILRSWARSKQPALQLAFVQYAFGKPPDKLEVNELEHKPVLILRYAHEFDRLQRERELQRPGDDNGEGTHRPLLPDAD